MACVQIECLRRNVGFHIEAFQDKLKSIVRSNHSSNREVVRDALGEIAQTFFKNPHNFRFSKEIKKKLIETKLKEEINELCKIPLGNSELAPLPKRGYNSIVIEDRIEVDYTKSHKKLMVQYMLYNFKSSVEQNLKHLSTHQFDQELNEATQKENEAREAFLKQAELVRKNQEMSFSIEGAIKLVSKDGLLIASLEPILRNNKKVAIAAVTNNGLALKDVHPRLQKDNTVVGLAITQNPTAFLYAAQPFLLQKKEVLKTVLQKQPLKMGEDELEEDKDFIQSEIREEPRLFRLVDPKWSLDKAFIAEALLYNRSVQDYIDPSLREFVYQLIEIRKEPASILVLPKKCLLDPLLVREAIYKSPFLISHMIPQFSENKRFILTVLRDRPQIFKYLKKKFRFSVSFRRAAAAINPSVRSYFPKRFQVDLKNAAYTRSSKTRSCL